MNRVAALVVVLGVVVTRVQSAGAAPPAFADEPSADEAEAAETKKAEPERPSSEEPDVPAPPRKLPPPIGLRFDGGWSAKRLFDIPVTGADMGLAGGVQFSERGAAWVAARGMLGATEHGLRVWNVRVGPEAELVFDRFRLGAGLGAFLIGVERAARSDTLLSWGPELRATARFDVVRTDGFALFARAAFDAAYEVYDGSLFWGPTLGAGGDFDVAGKRPPR